MTSWWVLTPIIVSLVASLTFTLLFGLRSRWYTNPIGKMQFHKSVTLTTVFTLILVNSMLPDYTFRETIRFIVYSALAVALWGQVYMLILVQQGKIQGPNYGRRHDDIIKPPGNGIEQIGDIEMQERM